MPSSRFDEARDYAFADKALALRKRAGLTQRELATALHVNVQSIHGWENGLFYPGTEHLQRLVALYLERGVLMAGREEAEAEELWVLARARALRRTAPFDRAWFARLHGGRDAAGLVPLHSEATIPRRQDWGDKPVVPMLRGRSEELATLARWVRADRCRVVQVLGPGGIGKTVLTARLAQDLAPEFPVVYWHSLRNAPPPEEWLAGAITALSAAQVLPSDGLEAQLGLLLGLLRDQRGLLVLDNLETVLEAGAPQARYRAGYEGYGEALRRLVATTHQGCLLLTSREQPLRDDELAVRSLRLGGLGVEDGRALLASGRLAGDETAWRALVECYAGNPLALRVVGETIGVVFGGEIAAFLAQQVVVFGDIQHLLDEQVTRLSPLEQTIEVWLAVEREPVGFAELVADLGPGVPRGAAVEALEALARRSLLERGAGGGFTLQPVVLEYATQRLVERVCAEALGGELVLFVRHALVKAQAKDYVRRSQERLIAQPLLEQLRTSLGSMEAVQRRLLALLGTWRGRGAEEQGYGPGNVVNLLRLLRGELRGLDLSRLSIRQAYLQRAEAQDASLAGAHLAEAVLAEAFDHPTSVALSADGAYLAAGMPTGEVRLWRVADRMLLLVEQAYSGGIWGVALSGDGRLLASGSEDGTIKLWDAAPGSGDQGQLLATLQGHASGVRDMAFSGDGRLLASGSLDGTVKLWDVAPGSSPPGQLLATLQGHTRPVVGVALSGDGRLLASGGLDGTVKLWEAAPGSGYPEQLVATLQGHTGGVWGVALSGDGRLLASGSEDGTIKLWEAAPGSGHPGKLLATLQGHTGAVIDVALSGDGHLLASGTEDGTIKLWETTPGRGHPGQLLATLQGHIGAVIGVALSGDGRLLASGSEDGTIKLWETTPGRGHLGQLLATLQGHIGGIMGVALSGDECLVASGSFDGTVRLWDAPSGRLLATLQGHTGWVRGMTLSGDGRLVASGDFDGTVKLWEAPSGRLLAILQGHAGGVRGIALSGDGCLLASGGLDGAVKLWETAPGSGHSGQLLATLHGHTGGVRDVALSEDGRLLASGGLDGTVKLWDAPRGQLLATLHGHSGAVWGVALSSDGCLLASGSFDGTAKLWEVAPASGHLGQLLTTLHQHKGDIRSLALSGDGCLLATGGLDGMVMLWEAVPASGHRVPSGWQFLASLQNHTCAVVDMSLSRDGRLLASGGLDGAVKLWDVRSGACLRTLRTDRRYERLNITGLSGITEAQRAALLALGALQEGTAPGTESAPVQGSSSRATAADQVAVSPLPPGSLPLGGG